MIKTGFMQLVPGSFTSKPLGGKCGFCEQDTGGNHALDCPIKKFQDGDKTPKFRSQPLGEQCGRCWQNHTPGFVCACGCHIKINYTTTNPIYDNGDDLDAPQNT